MKLRTSWSRRAAEGGQHEYANATTVHESGATGSRSGRSEDGRVRRCEEARRARELRESMGIGRTTSEGIGKEGPAAVERC